MVVFTVLMIFGFISFGIPKRYMQLYMVISSVCISSLYFFYDPPVSDLYRHYETLHIIRECDLFTILFKDTDLNNTLLAQYSDGSKLYLVYAYLISQFRCDELLPVITGIIIYCMVSKVIIMAVEDLGQDIEDWKIGFCYFFLLAMMDFRTISGIRNMLAFSLCAYVLYIDLVRNANKFVCFIAYFLIANIHSSIVVLIFLRLLVMLNKVVPKVITIGIATLTFTFIDVVSSFLMRYKNIPFLMELARKINSYGHGGGSSYILVRGIIRLVLTIFYYFIYLYARRNSDTFEKYGKYGDFYVLVIFFTLGAIRQYDLFVRNNILLYYMIFPFLLFFLKNNVCSTPFQLYIPEHSKYGLCEFMVYVMIVGCIALSLVMYFLWYYTPMDSRFIFWP